MNSGASCCHIGRIFSERANVNTAEGQCLRKWTSCMTGHSMDLFLLFIYFFAVICKWVLTSELGNKVSKFCKRARWNTHNFQITSGLQVIIAHAIRISEWNCNIQNRKGRKSLLSLTSHCFQHSNAGNANHPNHDWMLCLYPKVCTHRIISMLIYAHSNILLIC